MRRPCARRRDGVRRAAGIFGAVAGGLAVAAVAAVLILARAARRAECEASSPIAGAGLPAALPQGRVEVAIVVLGATAGAHGPSAELRARLDHAAALWLLGAAPLILVSGGTTGAIDEAAVMRDYLISAGIQAEAIGEARPGGTTRETLRALARRGPGPYVLVSSPYHALRLRSEARRQGIVARVSAPASTPETRRPATHRVRFGSELVALVWYALPPAWTARTSTRPGTARHVVPHVLVGRRPPRDLLRLLGPGHR